MRRYTIQNAAGEYLHILSYIFKKPPFWTRDLRDSVVFALQETANDHIAKTGIRAKVVPRNIMKRCA